MYMHPDTLEFLNHIITLIINNQILIHIYYTLCSIYRFDLILLGYIQRVCFWPHFESLVAI